MREALNDILTNLNAMGIRGEDAERMAHVKSLVQQMLAVLDGALAKKGETIDGN